MSNWNCSEKEDCLCGSCKIKKKLTYADLTARIAELEEERKTLGGKSYRDSWLDSIAEIAHQYDRAETLQEQVGKLTAERDELNLTFDLSQSAYERGTKAWQEATGKTLAVPDTACMVQFLCDERDTLQTQLGELSGALRKYPEFLYKGNGRSECPVCKGDHKGFGPHPDYPSEGHRDGCLRSVAALTGGGKDG